MKKLLALLFVLCGYPLWATTLTGTIKNPDGTGVNGSFLAKLVMNSSQKATGSCAGPNQIVPTTEVRFPLSNGAFLPANPTIVGNDCLLPLNTYYIVRVTDSTGRTLFTDNWIITGTTIDVGTIVSANITALQTTVVTGIGTGTQNSIARWLSSTSLGNSGITDDGTVVTMTEPISRTYNGSAVASNLYLKSNGTTQFVPSTLAAGGVGSCAANNFVTAINADAAPTCAAGLSFPLLAPDGTTSAPSYSFTNATGTGMWRDSTGLEFSVGGTNELQMTSGQIRSISDGTITIPAFSFNTATNTGMLKASGVNGSLELIVAGIPGIILDNNGNVLAGNGGNIGSLGQPWATFIGTQLQDSTGTSASAGFIKISNAHNIAWNNGAGTANVAVTVDANNKWNYGGVPTVLHVSTDFTLAANTNLQTITGLTFTLPANTVQKVPVHCHLLYSQATGAVADQFGIQSATISPTNIAASGTAYTSTTVFVTNTLATLTTTTATAVVTFTPSTTATVFKAELDAMIENPSNASTNVINIMAQQSNSSDLLTVKQDSFCRVF